METRQCKISGRSFTVSPFEKELRSRFGFEDLPTLSVPFRFRELGAFWPQWNLHPRKCDKTGRNLISIFRPDCEYPVWEREEWIREGDPPHAEFDFTRSFFDQAWELFRQCPLPHTFQSHNENCEYTDDFYYSKNCYLCHSCNTLEDCRYCYLGTQSKNVQFCIYSQFCELGSDIVHCRNCFDVVHVSYCREVSSSSFLYDCRNCSDCMFCCNLRNKTYCFENQQLTKAQFQEKKVAWDLRSRTVMERAKKHFLKMMREIAWHRALHIDFCENSSGNYITNCKNCEDCFISPDHEDCVHDFTSGPNARATLDSMGTIGSELSYYSVMVVYCYQTRFSFELNECRFCDYCAYCFQCQYCFGCCGLRGKRYCIFNKQYSEAEYHQLHEKIIRYLKDTGEWGHFFPGHFAPNPYNESCSGFHFPLSASEQEELHFRNSPVLHRRSGEELDATKIPDSLQELYYETTTSLDPAKVESLLIRSFWDEKFCRPFRITKIDIENSHRLNIALPNSYYIARMQENFRLMPFTGSLRNTTCGKSGNPIRTSWPEEYDGRILSEEEYLKIVR